ncbi:Reverse transcriptase zinc-binding domain [Arabidopsis thaliana x Arabidopsis arenosa]|uniref:Reverse transcriptase zinc-binding domain n=1 Tax=Arabidopsis thaliana x Arabidopsis arenosa TaxID=1240361 RepID=A0A8T1XH99_9BRAS|nr:Reverse transcriptase zinc-binding domain [Arabidopsis thaliana x Arabidopsis arenosa]
MISCEVKLPDCSEAIVVSSIYGANEASSRQSLWGELVTLSTDSRVRGKAWIVLGDFNQVLHPSEHSTVNGSIVDRSTRIFRDTLVQAGLEDLNFRGNTFTWWNKRRNAHVAKKLDRILVNDRWTSLFPSSLGQFSEPDFSDHACCEVSLDTASPRKKSPFRFYNFLLKSEEFLPLVCFHWFSFNVHGSAMYRLSRKLKKLKSIIREFSKMNYSDIEKRTQEAHEKLILAQKNLLLSPSPTNADIEVELHRKWLILSNAEESFFCQRSRVTWLREGDLNTSYFHKIASARQSRNHIHYLLDSNGDRIDTQSGIQNCVEYFKCNFGGDQDPSSFIQEDISLLLRFRCNDEQRANLNSDFSSIEIREAFFSLPRNKASGPDGYTPEFFCSSWSVIGSEMTDFRPISCLNTVYKVISKLLAGRLKTVLPSCVNHAQSAFLPGRLLLENVLLATEIIQGYNRKDVRPSAMLKVDLRKAFDSVRWDFIIAALRAINLPEKYIGDSLSPYLFLLAMEVFSGLLHSRYESGYINYHPKTSELEISHLMFADDVMIFFGGDSSSLHGIYETLEDFAGWSGLHMNRGKTQLFHAGLSLSESTALASYGFTLGSLPIRYLGLSLMSRKLKISEYAPLIEKITARFNAWAVKSLSFAGRIQLISSVISGLVNFWISAFILPLGCIRKIESLCSRFLWSGSIDSHGMTKVSWAQVCLPKEEGGLGLRRFASWNRTLCLRMIWLLFSESGSLWVAWQRFHNYSSITSFWNQTEKANDSWNWKCILKLRRLAENFIKCRVGNGRKASFWFDNWTSLGPLIKFIGPDGPRSLRVALNATVAEACDHEGWILAAPRSESALSLHVYLTTISLPSNSLELDTFDWVVEDMNCVGFSSSKTWSVLRPRADPVSWFNSVWFKGATPRHAFNMWVANLDRLPTKARLARWGMNIDTICSLCSSHHEDRDHLLITCDFALFLWNAVITRLHLPRVEFTTWSELLTWTRIKHHRSPPTLRKLVVQCVIYNIWKQRNNFHHNQIYLLPSLIFLDIDREIKNTITARRHKKRFKNLMTHWLQ